MRLKDYSMRIKKNIAVFLHILFLLMTVLSISVMYLNTSIGSGVSWILDRRYDDSDAFREQFQEDLDHVFPTGMTSKPTAIWTYPRKCLPSAATTAPRSPIP